MSQFNCKDELKYEPQHAASVPGVGSPARGARGDSPRLTPNRIFTSHLDRIIKSKEKEKDAKSLARHRIKTEVKEEVEEDANDDAGDPTPSDLHLPEERQEPYGAECDDSSLGRGKEEIRIHLTTEVHLIPLPGENNLTELVNDTMTDLVDDTLTGEDEVSNSFEEPLSSQPGPEDPQEKSTKGDSHRRRSRSSKKRKKKLEESPEERIRSPTREARRKSSRRSKKDRRSAQSEESDKPSPTKHRSRTRIKEEVHDLDHEIKEENGQHRSRSSSVRRSLKDSLGGLNQSWGSVSPPRNRHDERRGSSLRRYTSPIRSHSSSNLSTPVKIENFTPVHQLRTLHPLSKMSSSENFVDVAVSSASEDEIVEHEVFTVRDHQREMQTPSAMSSRSGSGSGCSKPSTALDFIPFCAPRPAYQSRKEMYTSSSSSMTGSPYVPQWHYPYEPGYEQHFSTPPPAMDQGVFNWRSQEQSDAIAALVQYPPPPHRVRPLLPNFPLPPTPPGTTPDYPIRRHSSQPSEEHHHAANRLSLPSNLPGRAEYATEAPQLPPPAVDRRFTCLQSLHNPPRPSIFGYQLIGDSMLVRFAQQILGQPPTLLESLRFIGYCVSGQRIGDLLKRLKSGFYHLNNKVVLMIGTNDLVKNSQAEQMIYELRRVLEHLCTKAEKIVVLTLPPIPRYEHYTHHWIRLNKYNDFIRTLNNADMGISVFDISPQYLLSKEELEEEELLAEFNSDAPFCRGCLTCMEEVEEFCDSSWSDEDDMLETDLLTNVFISTSPPNVSHLDICHLYCSKRISKCKMDCFELKFSESSNRKDLIHLNRKGLLLVKDALYKLA